MAKFFIIFHLRTVFKLVLIEIPLCKQGLKLTLNYDFVRTFDN